MTNTDKILQDNANNLVESQKQHKIEDGTIYGQVIVTLMSPKDEGKTLINVQANEGNVMKGHSRATAYNLSEALDKVVKAVEKV